MEPTFAGCSNGQPCRVTPSPYTDWFLQTDKTPVYSMSACEQMGLGYSNPGTDKCANLIWNVSSHNQDINETNHPHLSSACENGSAGTYSIVADRKRFRGSGGERFDA